MTKAILVIIGVLLTYSNITAQECLDVNFKLRGYFYVGTSQEDSDALGGFYKANNSPIKITKEIKELSKTNSFQIIVQTDSIVEFEKGVIGFKVLIINATDSTVELPAQDSRIYLKRQVYFNDEWRDVEYLPSSWCGNSYHSVFIKSNEYWNLKAPCIQGKLNARFRFELIANESVIHSNEFMGSFNKRQLNKEQGHKPNGIMDPYNN